MNKGLKVISIFALIFSLIGCSEKELTNNDFDIKVDKEISEDGTFEVNVDFQEGTPKLNYKLYLDGQISASGTKKNDVKDGFDMDFKDLKNGEHTFKLEVETDSKKEEKELKVKVESKDSENEINNKEPESNNTWDKSSIEYKVGDKVKFDGIEYECIMAHTSQESWTPKDAPSLWKEIKTP